MFFFIAFFCFSCFLFNFCTTPSFFCSFGNIGSYRSSYKPRSNKSKQILHMPISFQSPVQAFLFWFSIDTNNFFSSFFKFSHSTFLEKNCKPFCQSFLLYLFSEVYTMTDKIVSFVTFFSFLQVQAKKIRVAGQELFHFHHFHFEAGYFLEDAAAFSHCCSCKPTSVVKFLVMMS